MRKILLGCFLTLWNITSFSQSYFASSAEVSFFDQSRNRAIPALIYYPSLSSGQNQPIALSQFGFPVVSFGHGFVIEPQTYDWLGEELAQNGYIVVFPATEGLLLPPPDHLNFGRDIRFCAQEIIRLGKASGNPLSGKVNPRYALMGHSMGGGATYLGAAEVNDASTTITFAAAETNPSAINAAANVNIPSLVIAAEEDCVTPVGSNQTPMFQNLSNPDLAFVNIGNASHCNFTNGNASLCYLGEAFPCLGSGPFISRNVQHERTLAVVLPWLAYHLKAECEARESFDSQLQSGAINGFWTFDSSQEIQCSLSCDTPSGVLINQENVGYSLSWNPVQDALGYQVQARLGSSIVGTTNTFETSLTIDQLDNSQGYEFRIRAFCPSQGLSSSSDWQSVQMPELRLVSNGALQLEYNALNVSTLIIFDLNGIEVARYKLADLHGQVPLQVLPIGFYTAQLIDGKTVARSKFSIN